MNKEDAKSWLERFQRHIHDKIAPLAIPETSQNYKGLRRQMVNEEAMKIWIRSVTHSSYRAEQMENYETLENLGDPIMKLNFGQILVTKYPNIDQQVLTDVNNQKVWKNEQAKLSDKLGLSQFLRSVVLVDIHIREDLLESMFAALYQVGERILGPSIGATMCTNVMISLYGDIVVNFDFLVLKNPKVQLKEIGDKLHWFEKEPSINEFGAPRENVDRFNQVSMYTLTYTLTAKARRWLQNHGFTVENNGIIAKVTRPTKDDTIDAAAADALSVLKRVYQLDWYVADKYSKGEAPESEQLGNRMKEDGITAVKLKSFKNKDEKGGPELFQLIGTKLDGNKTILLTMLNRTNATRKDVQRKTIKLYEQKGRRDAGNVVEYEES